MKIKNALRKWKVLTLILGGLFSLVGCQDSDDVGENYTTFTGETISSFLEKNPNYSEFVQALRTANAFSLLESYGAYTCFVPDNQAMEKYVRSRGYSSMEDFLDSVQAVKEMVFYHIIDGESKGVGAYETSQFSVGNIDVKNMIGRYLYTNVTTDGSAWVINDSSRIVSGDHIMMNGVIHLVDRVLAGNMDLLPDYIEAIGKYKLYTEALRVTGLRDSLLLLDDEDYVPMDAVPPTDTWPLTYPQTMNYRFTALLETDSLLAVNGIHSLNDMREYAYRYYPEGKDLPDKNPGSSLYRFVAYHFLPQMLTSRQFVNTREYLMEHTWIDASWLAERYRDGSFWLEQYLLPMAQNSIITVQAFKWPGQEAQKPIFNDERNCYDAKYTNMAEEENGVITLDLSQSNLDCQNGVIHSLTGMLVYDQDKLGRIMRGKRVRMDLTTFMPELRNNDIIASGSYYIPQGYCKNLKFEQSATVYAKYISGNIHSDFQDDYIQLHGLYDATFVVGPIPAGSYEVRAGYRVSGIAGERGMVQYYLDEQPCGIPVNMGLRGSDAQIGWEQVYETVVLNGGAGGWAGTENPDDYYGYENDKSLHNRGYMKGPDCYGSTMVKWADSGVKASARNDPDTMRKVLGIFSWDEMTTHEFRVVQMSGQNGYFDYIEFIPTNLLESEDTH